jgi:lipopolysaccharide biosynthesis glycosyltransferase
MYDLASNALCSTEFAVSRFLVPILCQSGWALFTDCDVVFMANPRALMALVEEDKAVMVVKHNHHGEGLKMGGMTQTDYPRKNWSSIMLFNCDHPANKRLTIQDVNERPGRDLHAFYWLHDSEIGELPAEWNWLVGVTEEPVHPKIAHFTNGGPWIADWQAAEHDGLWQDAANG